MGRSTVILLGAFILMLTFGVFAFLYTHIKFIARSIRKGSWSHFTSKMKAYYHQIAFGIDQLGNVICRDIFNDWFLKNHLGRKEYGSPDLTVSHVTGVNEHGNHLTFMGRLLAGILNAIDPNHTDKARNNDQFNG